MTLEMVRPVLLLQTLPSHFDSLLGGALRREGSSLQLGSTIFRNVGYASEEYPITILQAKNKISQATEMEFHERMPDNSAPCESW